jgi:hypothetical protein
MINLELRLSTQQFSMLVSERRTDGMVMVLIPVLYHWDRCMVLRGWSDNSTR